MDKKLFALVSDKSSTADELKQFLSTGKGVFAIKNLEKYMKRNLIDYAAGRGADFLSAIVEVGVDIETPTAVSQCKKITPLMVACEDGDIKKASNLLEVGADISRIDTLGRKAIHRAIKNVDLMSLLISHGADGDAMSSVGSVLEIACCQGSSECINLLLDNGVIDGVSGRKPSLVQIIQLRRSFPEDVKAEIIRKLDR